jgi:hypothetical protein
VLDFHFFLGERVDQDHSLLSASAGHECSIPDHQKTIICLCIRGVAQTEQSIMNNLRVQSICVTQTAHAEVKHIEKEKKSDIAAESLILKDCFFNYTVKTS